MTALSPRTVELLLALVSIAGGAFVAGVEAAASSVPEARLRALVDELGGRRGNELKRFLADPQAVHTRLLALRVTAIVLGAVLASNALFIGRAPWWRVTLVVATLTFTYGLLAEVCTTVARARARALLAWGLAVTRPLEWLVLPIAVPLLRLGRAASARARTSRPSDPPRVTEHTVEYVVEEAETSGALDRRQGEMLHNVLDLNERSVREIMVPRTRVLALEEKTTVTEALRITLERGCSRVPVYSEQIDNVVGVLLVKDLFRVAQQLGGDTAKTQPIVGIGRKATLVVPPTQSLFPLLREMQSKRMHLALVVDEFGALSGVVTLEDVLEELVGDIRDEHDEDVEPSLRPLEDGAILAAGDVSLADVASAVDVDLPQDATYHSLGGFLTVQNQGHVPAPGTQLAWGGIEFTVRESDERRVTRVEIRASRTSQTRLSTSAAIAAE